ncbi:hypothetical protein LTR33_009617 [Friedmanniomyces endolithicus]|nr:hypothetical protein LTR33_009617 [Friedmanniomyces endolithicus]
MRDFFACIRDLPQGVETVQTVAQPCTHWLVIHERNWACSIFEIDPAAYDGSGTVLQRLIDAMQTVDASWQYQNGDRIACIPGSYEINVSDDGAIGVNGGICSFLQAT